MKYKAMSTQSVAAYILLLPRVDLCAIFNNRRSLVQLAAIKHTKTTIWVDLAKYEVTYERTMAKYKVTYERTMEIEADSEDEAIHKAIVEVSENCADSIGYTAELIKEKQSKSKKAKPILGKVTTDEADKIEKLLNDYDCTGITRTEERIMGWLETFEIDITLNTIDYRFWCHTDGFLPNCPVRSIGVQDKGTDSVNFVLKFLTARLEEWKSVQKKKLK